MKTRLTTVLALAVLAVTQTTVQAATPVNEQLGKVNEAYVAGNYLEVVELARSVMQLDPQGKDSAGVAVYATAGTSLMVLARQTEQANPAKAKEYYQAAAFFNRLGLELMVVQQTNGNFGQTYDNVWNFYGLPFTYIDYARTF